MGDAPVKVSYSPINEVVVHEYVQMDMDDLLRGRISPAGAFPLFWCGGWLYAFNSLPWTRDVVKDYMNGKTHWVEVHCTRYDKYRPVMELNDENYKQVIKIRVIDTSKSSLHRDFVKWLNTKIK